MSFASLHYDRTVGRLLVAGVLGLVTLALAWPPARAQADLGDCGQPASDAANPTASDALATLRAAVGVGSCALSVCDVDGTCSITAGDALRVLRRAVGDASVIFACTCGATTTSTTSTTLARRPSWPADRADYVAGPLSYVNTLAVPAVEMDVPVCCKDFGDISKDFIENGTHDIDNGLAELAPLLALVGIDFEAQLNASIQDGSLVVLLDHQFLELDGGSGPGARGLPDDEFALVQLEAVFADGTTYAEASTGNGEFVVLDESFLPGTAEPAAFAFPAFLDVDRMSAGPLALDLTLSFGLLDLDIVATAAEIIAVPGPITSVGIPYFDATISGILLIDDVFESFNAVLESPDCGCLELTEDVFRQQPDGTWTASCVPDGAALCPGEDQAVCATLAGMNNMGEDLEICALIGPVLQDVAADLDLDGDPSRYEGMSIGLRFTAVTASSSAVEP